MYRSKVVCLYFLPALSFSVALDDPLSITLSETQRFIHVLRPHYKCCFANWIIIVENVGCRWTCQRCFLFPVGQNEFSWHQSAPQINCYSLKTLSHNSKLPQKSMPRIIKSSPTSESFKCDGKCEIQNKSFHSVWCCEMNWGQYPNIPQQLWWELKSSI